MGGMNAIIAEFLAESVENLDSMDQDLVALEKDPANTDVIERIFRTIHTIKGTCGFLAFGKLEALTHSGETVLAHLRDGTLKLSPEVTTTLLNMVDGVRAILAHIEVDGTEGDFDYSAVAQELDAVDARVAAESRPPSRPNKKPRSRKATPRNDPPAGVPAPLTEKVTPATAKRDLEEAVGKGADLAASPSVGDGSLRVDIGVLDELMNLVGELVLARNQITQNLADHPDSSLTSASQRLDGITGDLQETVMRARMQPISSILTKLPRFVRDLTVGTGKEVNIELHGQETDLDKSVLEAIKTSLLHLVRNAVDHGIEDPDERVAKGKNRVGRIVLRAAHEGGSVVIQVRDDGAGLDNERILAQGVAAGLVDIAEGRSLSSAQVEQLVFHPGFSTAKEVTNVSGRGVGLDVVRANVESIGGSIEMQSEPGASMTFKIKIPLTLAIVSVILVHVAEQRFAIPQASVVELVRLDGGNKDLGIEYIHGVPVYRLRGRLLPLVRLAEELGLASGRTAEAVSIVVLQGDDRQFGILVESIDDSQEIVVKPLGPRLAGLPYAGATILGDGAIALIFDVLRIGMAAGLISDARIYSAIAEAEVPSKRAPERVQFLLLQGSDDERLALDLSSVSRLESVDPRRIEWVGDQQVVQYRGQILQLVNLEQTLPERRTKRRSDENQGTGKAPVVICNVDDRPCGLLVHRILDIVDADLSNVKPASRKGVRACAVIGERVNEILELADVIKLADPEFFQRPKPAEGDA